MSDFFNNSDISQQQAEQVVSETLNNCDDGELFLENSKSESLVLDDGKIKNTSFDSSLGFGFRAVQDDKTAFCHSNICLLYTSPSPRDRQKSRMPSSA